MLISTDNDYTRAALHIRHARYALYYGCMAAPGLMMPPIRHDAIAAIDT